ncbi:RagB/SusD family nutrient uptake outer membrane protein [Flavobacterium sp. JP2137]|uniref:RagB/SusD family nutrient uptake outer membrane protein n=1 Tax=Flavobacterium sp. JP2137 TaxID=3414510 RepID=UPI003D2FCE9C
MKKIFILISGLTLSLGAVSCDDFLDIEPEGIVIPKTQEDFRGLMTTAYSGYPRHKSLSALRTDELDINAEAFDFQIYREIFMWQDISQDNNTTAFPWQQFYNSIFYINHIITEGGVILPASVEKDQLTGEAHALRAYAFFDLVNLYALPYNATTSATDKAIPLALELDMEKVLHPETTQVVYDQIHRDIDQAKTLLQQSTQEKGLNYRFSKAALYAFEARVYLYQQQWENALRSTEQALGYKSALEDLNSSQNLPNLYTSSESILALEDTYHSQVKNASFASEELLNAFDAANDLRYPLYFEKSQGRFKVIKAGEQAQKVSIRTAELYLIQAEASLRLHRLSDAKPPLKQLIKNRYKTAVVPQIDSQIEAMDESALLEFITAERFREFALEGHRWFDLRRIHQKRIVHTIEGKEYILRENDPRYTLPYPQNARLNNPNL